MNNEFNPVEIAAWVAAEKKKLDFSGIDGPSSFFINADGCRISGYVFKSYDCQWGVGPTFAAALADLREKIPTGAALIQKKLDAIATLESEIRDLAAKQEETK